MTGLAWQRLSALDAYRVTQIPRCDDGERGQDPAARGTRRAQRGAVLTAAYHAAVSRPGPAGPVAVGWVRTAPGSPVHVLVAGSALRGSASGPAPRGGAVSGTGEVPLALPAGARGTVVPAGGLAAAMTGLPCWTAISGIADGLLAEEAGPAQPPPVSLDEGLLAAWDGAFGWLLLADPLTPAQAGKLAAEVADRQRLTAGLAERDPDKAVDSRRLALRHTELRRGRSAGLWRLHLLAGAADPEAAAQVAGLLCACTDTSGLPYTLAPSGGPVASLPELLDAQAGDPGAARAELAGTFPFCASTALLAALAQVPEAEVPGVRLVLRPEFDVSVEVERGVGAGADPGDAAPAALLLGTVLDRNGSPAGTLALPAASLNRHTFVCGATGAGKSQTVRALLEAASAAHLPWLVVEPAKSEYRSMSVRLKDLDVVRIRPGEADQVAAGINPLAPVPGFPLQTHADLVRALFLASFAADEPFPQVLSAAVTRVYEQAGWDLALGEPAAPGGRPGYPTLGDLQAAAERVVTEIGYGREITDNVRGFIRVRLSSLRLGTTGRFFEGGHPIDFGRLLDRNVVFEIEDVGDDRDKAFLMGTVLIQLTEHLRLRARSGSAAGVIGLRHLSVFEEAHRLLRRPDAAAGGGTGAAAHAVEMFAGLLAEIRAYGEGLVIAEQIPAKLIPDAIKNTAVKIVHRLPAADDRDTVGATMNLTGAQSRYLVTLPPGQAAVFADGMDFPVLTVMPDGTAREAAGCAVTAAPGAVVSPRSGTCGADCLVSPCTLRDMRAAQRVLDETPGLVLWAELAVLAHLTGWLMPLPAPGGELRSRLAELAGSARLADCAVSHAVDAAVACRVSASSRRVSPAALAEHVAAALRRWIGGRGRECSFPEPQWLAPAFRWALILDDLKTLERRSPGSGRHPESESWERSFGRPIPGETCAGQIGVVQRWYDADQRDAGRVRGVAFGTRDPAAVERAVGARASDEDWEQRLSEMLDEFQDCRWPLDYLRASPAAGRGR